MLKFCHLIDLHINDNILFEDKRVKQKVFLLFSESDYFFLYFVLDLSIKFNINLYKF